MIVEIYISNNPTEKFDAVIDNKKRISFGTKNYSDYTIHKDEDRTERYIKRHKTNQNLE